MPDNLTKAQRSLVMSRIRSKWTLAERLVRNFLKTSGVGHQMHPKVGGSPDIILPEQKKAILLHGCFWHKCPHCYREPRSRKKYWLPKLKRNIERDKENEKTLRKSGWKIIKIWEHELKKNKNKLPVFLSKKILL